MYTGASVIPLISPMVSSLCRLGREYARSRFPTYRQEAPMPITTQYDVSNIATSSPDVRPLELRFRQFSFHHTHLAMPLWAYDVFSRLGLAPDMLWSRFSFEISASSSLAPVSLVRMDFPSYPEDIVFTLKVAPSRRTQGLQSGRHTLTLWHTQSPRV